MATAAISAGDASENTVLSTRPTRRSCTITRDGCLPSDLATGSTPEIEEERRLLYVAMTRAKDQLHLMVPQRFFTHGQRLLYVAMTRAKDQLHLMVPQRFFTHGQRSAGDRHVYAQRTRFIPNPILAHFESCTWPLAKSDDRASDRRTRDPVDVRAKMRRMWG
jgi:DNA helicase-2/ATP-dependent DNA helicase PcrA